MAGTESLIIFKAFFPHCVGRTTERVSMTSGPFSGLSRESMIVVLGGGHFLFALWLVGKWCSMSVRSGHNPTSILCDSSRFCGRGCLYRGGEVVHYSEGRDLCRFLYMLNV